MGLIDKLLLQAEQLYDALDPILIPGLLYLPVRGWKRLRDVEGVRFAVVTMVLLCAGYVLLFGTAAPEWIQERYYRPIIPFAAVLAAMGYFCFGRDVPKKSVLYTLMVLVLAACLYDALEEPIRAHRRSQVEAGRWLSRYDPDYRGFIVSDYTVPVLYARAKYFDPFKTEDLFREMLSRGEQIDYIILDGEEEGTWYARYAREHGWRLVHRREERNIRIYRRPDADAAGMAFGERPSGAL